MPDLDHTLIIDAQGGRTIEHPDNDPAGCDFDAYVASDWSNPAMGASTWKFTHMPAGGDQPVPYWNGTYFG